MTSSRRKLTIIAVDSDIPYREVQTMRKMLYEHYGVDQKRSPVLVVTKAALVQVDLRDEEPEEAPAPRRFDIFDWLMGRTR